MVQPSPAEVTVINATNVFAQAMVMPQNRFRAILLAEAQAIAIVPSMVRGAFVFGVQHGRGVLVVRDAKGSWQPPRLIQITGGSVGYQIGVQATDLVLVFRTPQSVANLLRGTLKVGVDASAAAGPVGRQTSAATDLQLQAEILSYSRARGAFVGVSIDGSSISLDPTAEAMYYQPPGAFRRRRATAANDHRVLGRCPDRRCRQPASQLPAAGGAGCRRSARRRCGSRAAAARLGLAPAVGQPRRQLEALSRAAAEVYMPNQVPTRRQCSRRSSRYEEVSRDPNTRPCKRGPNFRKRSRSLRRLSEVRTASNSPLNFRRRHGRVRRCPTNVVARTA